MTGTIAEVTFPADTFALQRTLQKLDTTRFDIEQVVAHSRNRLLPFVWAGTSDHEAVESALLTDDSVRNFQLIAEFDTECLYQLEWVTKIDALVQILVEEQGAILTATGKKDTWNLRILFGDHDALARTYEHCETRGIDLEINTIQEFTQKRPGQFGLTQSQRQTLQLAHDRGYYSVPREVSAKTLAGELGVTHQSLSERLRRGHENLVKNTLAGGQ
ncbi:helix-turn-helix domain-containing protein [Haladaptatus cibarius]|uniref:helix-turn-helix domain-containing protein n=1 Tax=Haladaptatus cibarius TaxID=453847 RepID=UPI0006795249|nr:helix-turn-helix domain-containing protein [Haladaptatus cibarius]